MNVSLRYAALAIAATSMLPIGQALWLKELESYTEFPPMQDPASYNLDQVLQQVKNARTSRE